MIELRAKLREERLRWVDHVYRREDNYWKTSGKPSGWKKEERKAKEKMM